MALKRPKLETARINIRCRPEKKKAYEAAAAASEQRTLSPWIKSVLDRELVRLRRKR